MGGVGVGRGLYLPKLLPVNGWGMPDSHFKTPELSPCQTSFKSLSRNKGLRSKASISSGFGAAQRKQGVVCRAAQITDPSPFLSHEGTTTQNAAEVSLRSKSLMVELEQNPYLPAWS